MIVFIESPYNGDRITNLRYLAWCEYDSAERRGEFPIASHGNCPAYWPEDDEHHAKGFAWRAAIRARADLAAYYVDLGRTQGMVSARDNDVDNHARFESRFLSPDLFERFARGEYPPGTMRRVPV